MKQMRFVLASLIILGSPISSFGQGSVDIVQIYENFMASRVAAVECGVADKVDEKKFLSNQMTVTTRAMQALKERSPNVSKDELANKIQVYLKNLQTTLKAEIAKSGCASGRVEQLLKLYKIHATMALGG